MKYLRILFIGIICCLLFQAKAQSNGDRTTSEIEYAVNLIRRISPTYMWDSWRFRDIMYEKESNTVYFVIQLKNIDNYEWIKGISEDATSLTLRCEKNDVNTERVATVGLLLGEQKEFVTIKQSAKKNN